jgi:outer membrane protein TolC
MGQDTLTTGSLLRVACGASFLRLSRPRHYPLILAGLLPAIVGCTTLGPDFERPEVDLSASWLEADGKAIRGDQPFVREWWKVFGDPILDRLIERAAAQNLSLRVAGVRVLEARAALGAAVGQFYPQTQEASGGVSFNRMSESASTAPQPGTGAGVGFDWWQAQLGLGASWELDFWGRFRRGIESGTPGTGGILR